MFNLDYDSYEDENLIEDVQVYDPRDSGDKRILPLKFTLDDLDTFCIYVTNLSSDYITHAALVNAKTMFEILDRKPYMNNDSLKARLEYIALVLEARVDLNLTTKGLIKAHVLRNCDPRLKDIIDEEIIKGTITNKITDHTCKYLNTIIFENLIDGYSLVYSQKLMNLFDKKDMGHYKRITDFSKDLKHLVSEMDEDIRRSEEYLREGKGFDLDSTNIVHEVHSVLKVLRAPTNKLKTGLQYLNKMLNGGFESGRSYLFMGVTGVGKSIILLSTALWIKRYNKLPKIDGMRQAVLFISQENSKAETFERMFNINVTGEDIREFTDNEIVEKLQKTGLLIDDNDTDNINFIFRYFDDKEIGVTDIDALIDSFARKGIQIIAVVQDYIEKLRPKFKYTELRHSLGSIATEMSELAKKRNIPFISAAQLNRMASSVVDNAVANNKTNTTKLLGKQNISESWDMMKNVDAAIIINREIDDTSDVERQYLGFKLEKFRGKPNKDRLYVFLHPFDENNGILLNPDIEGKPLSRLRMEDFNPLNNTQSLVSSGRPSFTDYSETSNEFIESLKDIITDDYTDSAKNYIDVYKNAEEISNKMKRLHQMEIDLRERRKRELKDGQYKRDENNRIIIGKRISYINNEPETRDGLIVIKARTKIVR